jgi:uncharacterized protein YjiS (DUF1127 family)
MKHAFRIFTHAKQYLKMRAAKRRIAQLDDRRLSDIGVARNEIDQVLKTGLRRNQHFDF